MKKILSITFVLLSAILCTAQQWTGSTNTNGLITRDGNIVVGSTVQYGSMGVSDRAAQVIGNNSAFMLFSNAYSGSCVLGFYPQYNYAGINTTNHPFTFNIGGAVRLRIATNGAISIGSVPSTPTGYKLFVETGILTEKVKVAVATGNDWADYVFKKDYPLMPLSGVKEFIKEKGHLPGVPSAEEVVKNGIDLGKMDAKLLEKIEELTLYILQINKRLEQLEQENSQLKGNKVHDNTKTDTSKK